jgi:hypothetical protein
VDEAPEIAASCDAVKESGFRNNEHGMRVVCEDNERGRTMLDSKISLIPWELESTSSQFGGKNDCDKFTSSGFQKRRFFWNSNNNLLSASSSRMTKLEQNDKASTTTRATSALMPLHDFSS